MTRLRTIRGYEFGEVASALQKAIRRGDARLAGYWAVELFESGFQKYVWRRLLTISAEDCWGILTQEIEAMSRAFEKVNDGRPKLEKPKGLIFIAKAVILLSQAKKSRDADHLTDLIYDAKGVDDPTLEADLVAARDSIEPIPDYALDVHTMAGKRAGKTKKQFFIEEFDALSPRQSGLFDADVEKLKQGKG